MHHDTEKFGPSVSGSGKFIKVAETGQTRNCESHKTLYVFTLHMAIVYSSIQNGYYITRLLNQISTCNTDCGEGTNNQLHIYFL